MPRSRAIFVIPAGSVDPLSSRQGMPGSTITWTCKVWIPACVEWQTAHPRPPTENGQSKKAIRKYLLSCYTATCHYTLFIVLLEVMHKRLITNIIIIWVFIFCISQLSGCSFLFKKHQIDGPPDVDFDASKIPDAVPKVEPLSRGCNKDYIVYGKRYHVLKSAKGYNKRGLASWYGTKFHGQYTSNQERYSLYSMTAASRELPLPTYVKVKNLKNGKIIIVKVNDRGPFYCDRIIDLSYAAAKKLGFAGHGTALVQVTAIDPLTWNGNNNTSSDDAAPSSNNFDDTDTAPLSQTPHKAIYLQVGAFTMLKNAQLLATQIAKHTNKHVSITHSTNDSKHLYKVHIGPLMNRDQSNFIKRQLEQDGFKNILIIDNHSKA
jgi:rare lipoprotein A